MAKASVNTPSSVRLSTLQTYGALDEFTLPQGDFNPSGNYTLTYSFRLQTWKQLSPWGWFSLEKKILDADSYTLRFIHELSDDNGGMNRIEARLTCQNDLYATPISWTLTYSATDRDNHPVPTSNMEERGFIEDSQMLIFRNRQEIRIPLSLPVINSWALIDVISRMPPGALPVSFSLLDDFSMMKKDHRLLRTENRSLPVNGRTLSLAGIQHIGRGILPFEYWCDATGRPLFITSEQRLYILDEAAKKKTADLRRHRLRQSGESNDE